MWGHRGEKEPKDTVNCAKGRPRSRALRLLRANYFDGSWKHDQGEDLVHVSKQMGHSSPTVTANIYAHQIRAKRPDAAAKSRCNGVRILSFFELLARCYTARFSGPYLLSVILCKCLG